MEETGDKSEVYELMEAQEMIVEWTPKEDEFGGVVI